MREPARVQSPLLLVGRNQQSILATVMVGHDGHRGWLYYVAVDPDHRKNGYGRAIVTAAEDWLRARGIEKLQLMVRPENTHAQAFYETLDYDEQPRIIYAKVARRARADTVIPTFH